MTEPIVTPAGIRLAGPRHPWTSVCHYHCDAEIVLPTGQHGSDTACVHVIGYDRDGAVRVATAVMRQRYPGAQVRVRTATSSGISSGVRWDDARGQVGQICRQTTRACHAQPPRK